MHTISPGLLECMCWRQFAARCEEIAPLNAIKTILMIVIIIMIIIIIIITTIIIILSLLL